MSATKRDPRVTRYIAKRAPFARPVLKRLRSAIHGGGAAIEETIKWGMPTFMYRDKIVCGIAGFKAHCALWFRHGRAVVGAKPKQGMGSFGRVASAQDLPSAAALRRYVKKAMKLIDAELARKR